LFYNNTNLHCEGGSNPSFTSAGTVLEADGDTGAIYQLGLNGGAVSNANLLTTLSPGLGGFIYGKDGSVYAAEGGEGGSIIQINPATGAVLRTVAGGLTCPGGLAIDPLSGDLFFDDQCTGGGTDDATVYRIIDPANTNPSQPTSVVSYATLTTTPNGQMAFAPNGTLYAVSGYYNSVNAQVEAVSGHQRDGRDCHGGRGNHLRLRVAIGVTNADGSAQSLIVEPAGTLSECRLRTQAPRWSRHRFAGRWCHGSRWMFVLESLRYRLSTLERQWHMHFCADKSCTSHQADAGHCHAESCSGQQPDIDSDAAECEPGIRRAVYFYVTGANAQTRMVDTNASGVATLSYTATQTGNDFVTAQATGNSTALASNTVKVTWTAGQHVTFLGLNASPQGGTVNVPVNVVASLADESATPAAAVAGQSVTFSLVAQPALRRPTTPATPRARSRRRRPAPPP